MYEENFTFEDLRALARDSRKKTLKELGGADYLVKIKEVVDNLKINAKTKRDLLKLKKAEEYARAIIKKRLERILLDILYDFLNDKETNEELKYADEKERIIYETIMLMLKKHLDQSLEFIKGGSRVTFVNQRLVLVRVNEPVEVNGVLFDKNEIALIPLEAARRLELEKKVTRIDRL
jgi:hypothetical protein